MKRNADFFSLNRGVISPYATARLDIARIALSAEEQTNFLPLSMGPMTARPGTEYMGPLFDAGAEGRLIPFVFSADETAVIPVTGGPSFGYVQIWEDGELLTRTGVSSLITNPDFTTDLSGWVTTNMEWRPGMSGTGVAYFLDGLSTIRQFITNTSPNVEHGISIRVNRGEANVRIGLAAGGADYLEARLKAGIHSLAVSPPGNFYIWISPVTVPGTEIEFVKFELGQTVSLSVPIKDVHIPHLRYAQSGDVVFLTAPQVEPMRIERPAKRMWRVVFMRPKHGPMGVENITPTQMQVNAFSGDNKVITSSTQIFLPEHVGALFSLTHSGARDKHTITAHNQPSYPIKVFGTGVARTIKFVISALNLFAAPSVIVNVERSTSMEGPWEVAANYTVAADQTITYQDNADGVDMYVRMVTRSSGGNPVVTFTVDTIYDKGTTTGVGRVIKYLSETQVEIVVTERFGAINTYTDVWAEGAWSAYRGYPAAVAIAKGRLWLAGQDRVWASVVDDYENHDARYPGDAGPINRRLGEGAVQNIRWMLSNGDIVLGTDTDEVRVRSTAFDEPITALNFTVVPIGKRGSAIATPTMLDRDILFIDRSKHRLLSAAYGSDTYSISDLTALSPEILRPGAIAVAVQYRPETYIHCVLSDGTVAIALINMVEETISWVKLTMQGEVEDVIVLPGVEDDEVYYLVRVSGLLRLVRLAKRAEAVGGAINKMFDHGGTYSGAPVTSLPITVPGSTVGVWGDGTYLGVLPVSGGTVTLAQAVSNATYGQPYMATYKSAKLAAGPISLISKKRIVSIGVLLLNTHPLSLRYGQDATHLDRMPLIEEWKDVVMTTAPRYNETRLSVNGRFTVDARLILEASSPYPCTVSAVIVEKEEE